MSTCKGIKGLLFGHDYRPRYNQNIKIPGNAATELKNSIQFYIGRCLTTDFIDNDVLLRINQGFESCQAVCETYVCDVCVRCGHTIRK